ncbi:hypothetical protein D9756_011256 [Leucocoprinus leucothites]|uniref:Uncharacterized protein n=1 Tax=Leucocoprinus leucothites TaxID=201217 RepID=A0A8H5CM23_9AGAR|nr:hypothetical protein D9756_011256 [Leucoagaricus leucothites]
MGYKCLVKSSDEEEQFPWVSSSKSIYSFLSVINSNHPVGSLIHDFSLALSQDGTEGLELNCSDLHHALQQMVSLRRLGITFHSSTNISMAAVLVDLPCQLTSLCLMDLRSFGNPDEANAFNTFISSQHHIKYLHLITTSLLYPLPIHCPTLETFIGSPALFRGTLSDLPRISSLGLVDSPWSAAVPKSLLELTSSALSQVRVLTLYSCFFDEVDLEKLAEHLQSLEILNIVLDNRSTTNRLTKRAMAMLGWIHKFPQLQKVIWCALPDKRRLNQLSLLTEETQKNLTKSWFESLKNFREAYFAIGPM